MSILKKSTGNEAITYIKKSYQNPGISVAKVNKALSKINLPQNQKEGILEVIDIKTDDAVSRLEYKMDAMNNNIQSLKTYITISVGIAVLIIGVLNFFKSR